MLEERYGAGASQDGPDDGIMETVASDTDTARNSFGAGSDDADAENTVAKRRPGDRTGARALAFVLCVLLGVGGFVAGFAAYSHIGNKLTEPDAAFYHGSLLDVYGADLESAADDLLTDKPYTASRYFQNSADRKVDELVGLYEVYHDGIGDEVIENMPAAPPVGGEASVQEDAVMDDRGGTGPAVQENALSEDRAETVVPEDLATVTEYPDGEIAVAEGVTALEEWEREIYWTLLERLEESSYGTYDSADGGYPDEKNLLYSYRLGVAPAPDPPIVFDARRLADDGWFFHADGENDAETARIPKDFYEAGVKDAFERIYADELSRVWDFRIENYKVNLLNEYRATIERLGDSGLLYYIGANSQQDADPAAASETATGQAIANQEATGQAIANPTSENPSAAGGAIANVELNDSGAPADLTVFTAAPAFLSVVYDGKDTKASGTASLADSASLYLSPASERLPGGTTLYLAWPAEALDEGATALADARDIARSALLPAAAAVIISFVLFILLLVWTGRRRADGSRRLYAWDRVFVEIQVFLMFFVFGIAIRSNVASDFLAELNASSLSLPTAIVIGVIAFAFCAFELWCLLSLVRIIKARLFLRRLLTWVILHGIYLGVCGLARAIKSGFDGRNPIAKTVLLVALLWLVTALLAGIVSAARFGYGPAAPGFALLLLFTVLILALYFSVKWAKRYGALKRGVDEIAGGNLSYKIPVPDGATNEFGKLSEKINAIGGATELAMQNELKNQRLKTDLISNVSHDLKTPLTSIITYTDLLKKEGPDSENAADYLKVIDEKSRRLKKLTEDLFEAAKASSGAVPVRMNRIDLRSLINQELVELGDGLAGIDLNVIVGAEKEHYYVNADSQLLWRVVDNLLNNVRKYALPGSRVYIDLKEHGPAPRIAGAAAVAAVAGAAGFSFPAGAAGTTTLEIKNISAAKLNIPANELMERFQRGDESRATEGSGLGLSIARDLTRLMGGRFDIAIDGDLFKATVTLMCQG